MIWGVMPIQSYSSHVVHAPHHDAQLVSPTLSDEGVSVILDCVTDCMILMTTTDSNAIIIQAISNHSDLASVDRSAAVPIAAMNLIQCRIIITTPIMRVSLKSILVSVRRNDPAGAASCHDHPNHAQSLLFVIDSLTAPSTTQLF